MTRVNWKGIIKLNALTDLCKILKEIDTSDSYSCSPYLDYHVLFEEIDRRRLLAQAEKNREENQHSPAIHIFPINIHKNIANLGKESMSTAQS